MVVQTEVTMKMRRHIACLLMIALFAAVNMGFAQDKKTPDNKAPAKKSEPINYKMEKPQKPPVTVQKTNDGARGIYFPKGSNAGVYAGGGGQAPSHFNPKGEKKVEGGVAWRFGKGGDKKDKK
jgi:hypothetical protein